MKTIHIQFDKVKAAMKPMHGVDNGPKSRGFQIDNSAYFKEAGIPYARLHDTEYPLGSGYIVDVPQIFKNFDADPEDPASYDFRLTDHYLQAIKDCGTDIIYRLGASIENGAAYSRIIEPAYIDPPKDFEKWAQICSGIIRHYNEGWANGFHMNIRYWEIWNEPESAALWTGTMEAFNNFYVVAASYLKKKFPHLRFGGYGSIGFYPFTRIDKHEFCDDPFKGLVDLIRDFLSCVAEHKAPLDFFSWHLYSDDPEEFAIHARRARQLLDTYGFTETESIMDEWNSDVAPIAPSCGAYIASVLSVLQDSPVDIANYYDAQPMMKWWCGLFDGTTPKKGFYAMKAFNLLYRLGNQVKAYMDKGLYGCAAKNNDEGRILLSNYHNGAERVAIEISGFSNNPGTSVTVYAIDADHNLEPVRTETITGTDFTLFMNLRENTVLYVELTAGS